MNICHERIWNNLDFFIKCVKIVVLRDYIKKKILIKWNRVSVLEELKRSRFFMNRARISVLEKYKNFWENF